MFTKPPTEPGATLISEILVAADGSCQLPEMSTAEHDVTGGIEEKLKTAIAVVVKCGIPVYIVQVMSIWAPCPGQGTHIHTCRAKQCTRVGWVRSLEMPHTWCLHIRRWARITPRTPSQGRSLAWPQFYAGDKGASIKAC